MLIRNVILDWSGTLVDDLTPVLKTTNDLFVEHGLPAFTREQFRAEFCLPVRAFYEKRIPHVTQAELERRFLSRYNRYRDEIRVLPHTRRFLEFCVARRMGVFIASTVDEATYHSQMARFDLERYITRPYLGIVDKTETIHHILAECRLAPGETMFVGDMEHDIAAGKAGSVRTCAVLTGYNHAEKLRSLQPDLVCEHLGELQSHLENNHGAQR
jgi:phosphoglycolate phosphatase-like HAD superfamily hydrolase